MLSYSHNISSAETTNHEQISSKRWCCLTNSHTKYKDHAKLNWINSKCNCNWSQKWTKNQNRGTYIHKHTKEQKKHYYSQHKCVTVCYVCNQETT